MNVRYPQPAIDKLTMCYFDLNLQMRGQFIEPGEKRPYAQLQWGTTWRSQ